MITLNVFKYRMTYVSTLVSVAVMNCLALVQSNMLQVERPPSGFVLPTLIGLVIGLFMSSSRVGCVEKTAEQKRMFLTIVHSLSVALDERDAYTFGHSSRVTELTMALGKKIGLSNAQLETLHIGSVLHDVGKIGVPDSLLNKPYALSEEENDLVKQHPVKGERIIGRHDNPGIDALLGCIRSHHEHFDGSGYPDGLQGEQIPLLARVISIADAYDAMISGRPYRRAMTPVEALQELENCAGSQFDPRLAEEFKGLISNRGGVGSVPECRPCLQSAV